MIKVVYIYIFITTHYYVSEVQIGLYTDTNSYVHVFTINLVAFSK